LQSIENGFGDEKEGKLIWYLFWEYVFLFSKLKTQVKTTHCRLCLSYKSNYIENSVLDFFSPKETTQNRYIA